MDNELSDAEWARLGFLLTFGPMVLVGCFAALAVLL